MRLSPKGMAFIIAHEAICLKAYDDGIGVPTIAAGHTYRAGPPKVAYGMTITLERAFEIFRRDIMIYEKAVQDGLTKDVPQHVYDALVSLCFNIGPGNFKSSTVLRRVNQHRPIAEAAEALKWFNKAGGKKMAGLVKRREREATMMVTGRYDLPRSLLVYKTVAANNRPAGRTTLPIEQVLKMLGVSSHDQTDIAISKKLGGDRSSDGMLRLGSRGSAVKAWQKKLVRFGYLMQTDGIFGEKTRERTRAAQLALGLKPDGIVGPRTVQAMDAHLKDMEKGILDMEVPEGPPAGTRTLFGILGFLAAAATAAGAFFVSQGD